MRTARQGACLLYWFLSVTAALVYSDPIWANLFERVNRTISYEDKNLQEVHQDFLEAINRGAFNEAGLHADDLVNRLNSSDLLKSEAGAVTFHHQAISAAGAGELEKALVAVESSLEITEYLSSPMDVALFSALQTKAEVLMLLKEYEDARDTFRYAQHLAHRTDGVYTPMQLPLLMRISEIDVIEGDLGGADREQLLALRINEMQYGDHSEGLIPALMDAGAYFTSRASQISCLSDSIRASTQHHAATERFSNRHLAFEQAIEYYERAVEIIEDAYGENDHRLISPLRGLMETKLRQLHSRADAQKAAERITQIVEQAEGVDVPDLTTTLVEMGDVYTMTGSAGKAANTYQRAFQLMKTSDSEQIEDIFGTPTRIYPKSLGTLCLDRRPYDQSLDTDHFFAEASFAIEENGRPADVKIVDANVPNLFQKRLRLRVGEMRYRPRLDDNGNPISTEGLMVRQAFKLLEPVLPARN